MNITAQTIRDLAVDQSVSSDVVGNSNLLVNIYFPVSCCKGSDCLNLKVIDGGPGCSVEDSAKKQVVDASYSTCKHFTGSTSCGN